MNKVEQDATAYGVSIQPAEVELGKPYWRVVAVHHLTPEENVGKHHLYVDVLDENQQPVYGVPVRISWPGGEETLVTQDQGPEQPMANLPLWKGQVCAAAVLGQELPSDRVENVHTEHLDEAPGNTVYHHSFHVIWQRATKKVFPHYVLFGASDDPQTEANLIIALGYILRFKPAFGFKPEEAALADHVTIIGGPAAVSNDVEEILDQAGCWVHRVQGDSRAIDQTLAELQKAGTPF